MRKLLLFMCLAALPLTQKTAAQSVALANVPTDVELGSDVTFHINYTATVDSKLAVALFIFNVDGDGNLTPDWGTWKAGIVSDVLPVASNATYDLMLTVPGSLDPSSALPAGKTYVWSLTLTDANGGWIAGTPYATTFIATQGVVNDIDFTGTAITSINAGATGTVSYSYTLAQDGIVKIALSKYGSDNLWISDVASFIVNPATATSSTPMAASADIMVPADVVPSAQLTNGENYKWEIALFNPDWSSYLSGTKSDVTITALAGVAASHLQKAAVYPNPVSGILFVANVDIQTAQVADVTGKVLLNTGKISGIDVSAFASGIYFVTINNGKAVKFIKN